MNPSFYFQSTLCLARAAVYRVNNGEMPEALVSELPVGFNFKKANLPRVILNDDVLIIEEGNKQTPNTVAIA